MLLDPVLFAYRTSIQKSLKFTPFLIMYGRRARFPVEVVGNEELAPDTRTIINKYVANYLFISNICPLQP